MEDIDRKIRAILDDSDKRTWAEKLVLRYVKMYRYCYQYQNEHGKIPSEVAENVYYLYGELVLFDRIFPDSEKLYEEIVDDLIRRNEIPEDIRDIFKDYLVSYRLLKEVNFG